MSRSVAPVKVGLVGLGNRGHKIIPALLGLEAQEEIEVVGVADPEVSTRFDFVHYADWQALLAHQPKVMIVATPTATHYELVTTMLRSGCHVIVEKPLAAAYSQAVQLVDLQRDLPNSLWVLNHQQHLPAWLELQAWQHRGEYLLNWAHLRFDLKAAAPSWYSYRQEAGGTWLNLGWHLLSLTEWLFGQIESLSLELNPGPAPAFEITADHSFKARCKLESEMVVTLEASNNRPEHRQITVEWEEDNLLEVTPELWHEQVEGRVDQRPIDNDSTVALQEAIQQAIDRLTSPNKPDAQPALRTQQLITNGWESVRRGGGWVDV